MNGSKYLYIVNKIGNRQVRIGILLFGIGLSLLELSLPANKPEWLIHTLSILINLSMVSVFYIKDCEDSTPRRRRKVFALKESHANI
jgi:hypothetical protein